MFGGHRQRRFLDRLDAFHPSRVVIPNRTPRNAGGKAAVHRRATRRVITAQTHGEYRHALHIHVVARFKIVERSGTGDIKVITQVHAAKANHLALTGAIHQQARKSAPHQVRHTAQILNLLLRIKAAEAHHARGSAGGVFGVNKIGGEGAVFRGQLHDFYFRTIR